MKKFLAIIIVLTMAAGLWGCSARPAPVTPSPVPTEAPTAAPTETPAPTAEPTEEPAGGLPGLPLYTDHAPDGAVTEGYVAFLEDNFDVIAALWPDGISGIGFADLDLDGTAEMLLFDMGASAAMGVQFFDIVDGEVVCVSSVNEAAEAAFGGDSFSPVSVCAQLFGDFRLLFDGEQTAFYIRSANGTPEFSWEETVRFTAGEGGVMKLQSVCRAETETDTETGETVAQRWFFGGEECDEETYRIAQEAVGNAQDLGYEAFGVFQWNDMERYDTSLEGLLVMLEDAASGYALILA